MSIEQSHIDEIHSLFEKYPETFERPEDGTMLSDQQILDLEKIENIIEQAKDSGFYNEDFGYKLEHLKGLLV